MVALSSPRMRNGLTTTSSSCWPVNIESGTGKQNKDQTNACAIVPFLPPRMRDGDNTTSSSCWHVNMAQFVPAPSSESLQRASLYFRKNNRSGNGVWLSSKHGATVTISQSVASRDAVLALILRGRVHEEHFVSKLHFTWPQVQRSNGHSLGGGNAILVSYGSSFLERRKFAMQFETILEAENFFTIIQNILAIEKEQEDYFLGSEFQQEDRASQPSSVNVLITSSKLLENGFTNEANKEAQPVSSGLQLNARGINNLIEQEDATSRKISKFATESISQLNCVQLPPRFPCSMMQPYKDKITSWNKQEKGFLGPSSTNESQRTDSTSLKQQIMACLLDPGFLAFVDEVEKAWHEMEEDMEGDISAIKSLAYDRMNGSA